MAESGILYHAGTLRCSPPLLHRAQHDPAPAPDRMSVIWGSVLDVACVLEPGFDHGADRPA